MTRAAPAVIKRSLREAPPTPSSEATSLRLDGSLISNSSRYLSIIADIQSVRRHSEPSQWTEQVCGRHRAESAHILSDTGYTVAKRGCCWSYRNKRKLLIQSCFVGAKRRHSFPW